MVENTQATTTFMARCKNLLWGVLYALASLAVLLYGLVLTTNLLTQLHFTSGWFYVSVAVSCYLVLAGLIYALVRNLIRAFKRAFSAE